MNGIVIGLSALAGVWLGWWAFPICLSILTCIRLIERNPSVVIFLVCALSIGLGVWRSTEPPIATMNPMLGVSTGAVGQITSFPIPSGNGHRTVMHVSELCIENQCTPADDRVVVYIPRQHPALSRGQTLRVDWTIDTLQELPSGYRSFVASQGAEGSARVSRVRSATAGTWGFRWLAQTNAMVSNRLAQLLPGDAGALANGIVTGDDSQLAPSTRDDFRMTNTSHLTAVSGQNVSLILGFLSFWYVPKTPRGRITFHIGLVTAIWLFTLFVGMQSPALRAALVATLMIIGRHTGRRPDPVTLMSLTIGIIALLQPLVVHTVGFWLSAVASLALCLVMPSSFSHNAPKAMRDVLIAPMVASVVTMPIALVSFGTWSPIGILANALLAPIMTLAFPVSYAFALLAIPAPWLAAHFSWAPGILLDFALAVVQRLAPFAAQIRVDTLSPLVLVTIWTPILIGVWLLSTGSDRWIRRTIHNARRLATPDDQGEIPAMGTKTR